VVALRTGLAFLDLNNSDITPICDLEMDLPFTRFNDGKCDRQGRFWAGTMDEEYPKQRASLYRLDQDGSCVKIRGNVGISNGLGWSPDNKVFYYTDSTVNTIYAYDFNAEDGKISNERIFFETTGNYSPDGLTVDSDGFVWSAMWNGWKVVRFSPDGKVDKEIALPVQRPTSCTFGGFELSDLYITSARMDLTEEELKKQPDAGSVLVLRTKMKGLPEPKFMDGI
jgi:sugar lactone lactonase YvrE